MLVDVHAAHTVAKIAINAVNPSKKCSFWVVLGVNKNVIILNIIVSSVVFQRDLKTIRFSVNSQGEFGENA